MEKEKNQGWKDSNYRQMDYIIYEDRPSTYGQEVKERVSPSYTNFGYEFYYHLMYGNPI